MLGLTPAPLPPKTRTHTRADNSKALSHSEHARNASPQINTSDSSGLLNMRGGDDMSQGLDELLPVLEDGMIQDSEDGVVDAKNERFALDQALDALCGLVENKFGEE